MVRARIVVGDAQDDDRLVLEILGEFFAAAVGVFALYAEDHVGPPDVTAGDFDAGALLGAGGAGRVVRVVLEKSLGGGAAPLIA